MRLRTAAPLSQKALPTTVDVTDQKTDWNLGETIAWIRTRDRDRVARMWDLSARGAENRVR